MKYLFIYPNKEQRETISDRLKEYEYKIIVSHLEYVEHIENYKILCCNEEALYYIKKYDEKILDNLVFFNKECLNFYLKYNAYLSFKKNNINVVKKSKNFFEHCIAKPNFGFASLGVKKVNSEEELNLYYDRINSPNIKKILKSMYKKYFDEFSNDIVYEEVIKNNIFFSVPFIYYNKQIYSFPIEGIKTLSNSYTDFYWTEFLLNLSTINIEIKNKIDDLLNKLTVSYINANSVNMAEVMYNKIDKKIYLIEFSPRVPGGKLSKMIEYATGLNLNKISIDLFLNKSIDLSFHKKESVKLFIDLNTKTHFSNYFEKINEFSPLFNTYINYYFFLNPPTVGLVPGRFAPLHKGHEFLINYALQISDKVIILIFDTKDTCVPLEKRANWIKKTFPSVDVILAENCPDGHIYAYENGVECEIIQNEYIEKKLNNIRIDYVFHSTKYGDCVSAFLGAKSIEVDYDRKKIPISGTMIRNNINHYKNFLSDYVFEEYSTFLNKNNKNK